jgi:uncharacterized protein (DUF305 family)
LAQAFRNADHPSSRAGADHLHDHSSHSAASAAARIDADVARQSRPVIKGIRGGESEMMQAMMVPMSDDADRVFVAALIPDRQGAVDMAKIEL